MAKSRYTYKTKKTQRRLAKARNTSVKTAAVLPHQAPHIIRKSISTGTRAQQTRQHFSLPTTIPMQPRHKYAMKNTSSKSAAARSAMAQSAIPIYTKATTAAIIPGTGSFSKGFRRSWCLYFFHSLRSRLTRSRRVHRSSHSPGRFFKRGRQTAEQSCLRAATDQQRSNRIGKSTAPRRKEERNNKAIRRTATFARRGRAMARPRRDRAMAHVAH